MKRETLNTELAVVRGEAVAIIKNTNSIITQQELLNILREGIKENKIKALTPRTENGYTIYKFKIFDNDKSESLDFNISVKSSEKHLFQRTINNIKDLSNHMGTIKKINRARFAAGLIAGIVLFTISAPYIAKGLDKILEKESKIYDNFKPKVELSILEEEKALLEQEYIENLRISAQNGDESAQRELDVYNTIQELKQQNENSKSR